MRLMVRGEVDTHRHSWHQDVSAGLQLAELSGKGADLRALPRGVPHQLVGRCRVRGRRDRYGVQRAIDDDEHPPVIGVAGFPGELEDPVVRVVPDLV